MRLKQFSIRRSNQKNGIGFLMRAASYRLGRPVTKMVQYSAQGSCYPVCPRCKRGMEREYANYCDRCGQKLIWPNLDNIEIITPPISK